MRSSSLPAVLLAVCCAFLAGTVLHAFRVPVLKSAAAQTSSLGNAPPPFNPRSSAGLRPALPKERHAAIVPIIAQLAAFNIRNYTRAMEFQSMSLRQNFPSVQGFRHMMETAYPQFLHARKVQYGSVQAETDGLHVLVPLTFTGSDGHLVQATYVMVREGDPRKFLYRVEGVMGGARHFSPVMPGTGTDA